MKFSIIIPALNETSNIVSCINSITDNLGSGIKKDDIEIIIVDGGSTDGTTEEAAEMNKDKSIRIIRMKKASLPQQLNRGGAEAGGDVLLFLHADSTLASDSLSKIRDAFKDIPGLTGGAFTMKIPGRRFSYRILSAGGNIYCRLTKIYFGDRAMFIKKDAFSRLKGFKPLPVMSDFDLSLRMKKDGRVMLLKGPVISSDRKFAGEPFYRILYLIIWSIFSFFRGVDAGIIRKRYYS